MSDEERERVDIGTALELANQVRTLGVWLKERDKRIAQLEEENERLKQLEIAADPDIILKMCGRVVQLEEALTTVLQAAEHCIKENPEQGYYNPERKHTAWMQLKVSTTAARVALPSEPGSLESPRGEEE